VADGASLAVTNYGYTALGYFQQLSRGGSGLATATPIYTIGTADASLRPTGVTYGTASFTNSVMSTTSVTDSYYYDQLNQLREADNAAVSKTFSYDNTTGNLTAKSDTGSYSYGQPGGTNPTGPHQLQSIQPPASPPPPPNEIISASYSYDARGNMVSGEDGAGYGWTSFNQPQTIAKDGATVQYFYDMNHRRIAVTTTIGGTSATKLYLHDGSGAMAEAMLDQNKNIVAVLDYFSAGGTPVGMLTTPFSGGAAGTASMRYFHADRRGSITAISDDTGLVSEFDSYDPWGKRRQTNGGDDADNVITSAVAYGYIDEEKIAGVTDLINLNARIYNAHTGHFIGADPIGLEGGRNVYAYSKNNPTTFSDRTGLDDTQSITVLGQYVPQLDPGLFTASLDLPAGSDGSPRRTFGHNGTNQVSGTLLVPVSDSQTQNTAGQPVAGVDPDSGAGDSPSTDNGQFDPNQVELVDPQGYQTGQFVSRSDYTSSLNTQAAFTLGGIALAAGGAALLPAAAASPELVAGAGAAGAAASNPGVQQEVQQTVEEITVTAQRIQQASTIGDILSGYHPDTLIHLTPDAEASFSAGVHPETFFARLGDVSRFTVLQYQTNVVGGAAAAGPTQSVSGFVVAIPGSPGAFTSAGIFNNAGVTEYINNVLFSPSAYVALPH